jgi:hypothetical protein
MAARQVDLRHAPAGHGAPTVPACLYSQSLTHIPFGEPGVGARQAGAPAGAALLALHQQRSRRRSRWGRPTPWPDGEGRPIESSDGGRTGGESVVVRRSFEGVGPSKASGGAPKEHEDTRHATAALGCPAPLKCAAPPPREQVTLHQPRCPAEPLTFGSAAVQSGSRTGA